MALAQEDFPHLASTGYNPPPPLQQERALSLAPRSRAHSDMEQQRPGPLLVHVSNIPRAASTEDLEAEVHSCNFFKTKAKNVRAAAEHAVRHGGRVPTSYDDLAKLEGVRLASGSEDGSIKVWDLATGSCMAPLQGHESSGRVDSLAVLAGGVAAIAR